jgi:hypothetical protein
MMARLSNSSLLYINLALGFFVAIANGAALAMVLSGNAARLSGQKFEILMWVEKWPHSFRQLRGYL